MHALTHDLGTWVHLICTKWRVHSLLLPPHSPTLPHISLMVLNTLVPPSQALFKWTHFPLPPHLTSTKHTSVLHGIVVPLVPGQMKCLLVLTLSLAPLTATLATNQLIARKCPTRLQLNPSDHPQPHALNSGPKQQQVNSMLGFFLLNIFCYLLFYFNSFLFSVLIASAQINPPRPPQLCCQILGGQSSYR
jgi:hypothetical protein